MRAPHSVCSAKGRSSDASPKSAERAVAVGMPPSRSVSVLSSTTFYRPIRLTACSRPILVVDMLLPGLPPPRRAVHRLHHPSRRGPTSETQHRPGKLAGGLGRLRQCRWRRECLDQGCRSRLSFRLGVVELHVEGARKAFLHRLPFYHGGSQSRHESMSPEEDPDHGVLGWDESGGALLAHERGDLH